MKSIGLAVGLSLVVSNVVVAGHPVAFDVKVLVKDANEGLDIADFDGDGKLDVIAGRNWFRGDDWTPRPVRTIEDWNGYVASNGDFAYDVNGDGLTDVIAGEFTQGAVYWYENPGGEALLQGYMWPKHLLVDTGYATNEVSFLRDLNGDGKPEWFSNQWNKTHPSIIWELATEMRDIEVTQGKKVVTEQREVPTLVGHTIGTISGHGIAFGDINNDGREDLLFGLGWYERPEGDPLAGEWDYHADWDIHGTCPMIVKDFDGDGINDLLWSESHGYGVFLWRGTGQVEDGKLQFEETLVDDSFSQPHAFHLADLDGDGVDEVLTGKRVRAHNGKDPGSAEPPTMRYYVWNADRKNFDAYVINEGEVGIGLQIRTGDLDGDGDIDIAVPGKEGTQILFNQSK